jgi:hypothetical protein
MTTKYSLRALLVAGVIGLCAGVGLTLLGFVAREFRRGMASWGKPQVFSDAEVRERIKGAGIVLPPDAHALYYASAGFQDYTIWIGFSCSAESADSFMRAYAGSPVAELPTTSPPGWISETPKTMDPKLATPLWRIEKGPASRYFYDGSKWEPPGGTMRQVFYDGDRGRVLIFEASH